MSFHSDNAAAMAVSSRIESRLDLSLLNIHQTQMKIGWGGECIGWPNTWNRLHLDEWNFFFSWRGDKRKRRNLKWRAGFFSPMCFGFKKPGRSRRNTHFLIAVVMTDYHGWNRMTDGSLMSIRTFSQGTLGFVPHSKSGSVIVEFIINRHVRLPDEIIATRTNMRLLFFLLIFRPLWTPRETSLLVAQF